MKLSLFSLQDSTASQFGAPFVAVNDNSAVRSCCVEAANPASGPLHTHPGDFRVFRWVYLTASLVSSSSSLSPFSLLT